MKFKYDGEEHELILLTLSGSRFYGTAYELGDHPFLPDYESDFDFRGVFIASKNNKLGLETPIEEIIITGKKEDWDIEKQLIVDTINRKAGLKLTCDQDITLYEVRKFIKLALENNPNILDVLFTDDDAVFYENKKGKKLRDSGSDTFMSLKTKFTFSGYALSQLNRIRGTVQYSDNTLKILHAALLAGDIDDQWLKDNFKGLHEKKLKANFSKLPKERSIISEEIE